MPLDQTANFVRATLASAIAAGDSTIALADSGQLVDPANGEYNLVVWNPASYPRPGQDPAVEIVRATALDAGANTLTVDRGQEGTSAADHAVEAVLQLSPTAKMFADIDAKTSALSADGQTYTGDAVDVGAASADNLLTVANSDYLKVIGAFSTTGSEANVDLSGYAGGTSEPVIYVIDLYFATGGNTTGLDLRFNGDADGNGNYQWTARDGTKTTGADQISVSSPNSAFDTVNARITASPSSDVVVSVDSRVRRDPQSAAEYGQRNVVEELSSVEIIPDGTGADLLGTVYGRRLD